MPEAPSAAVRPVTTVLHGRDRTDPYAWIADPDDPEVAAYLAAERAYYETRTEGLREVRRAMSAEMAARVPADEQDVPWNAGGYRYRRETPAGREYARLLRRPVSDPTASESLLLDLQEVHDAGGTGYAHEGILEVSPDGRWLAWSIDLDGDEVYQLRFRDLVTGHDLDEVVPRTYYGGAWGADSSSFLYTVHDEAWRPYQVWRHVLGTPVGDDVLVLEDLDETMELELHGSRSGLWAVISLVGRGFREEHLIPALDLSVPPVCVRPREHGVEYELEHAPGLGPDGSDGFLVTTNLGAAEFHVMWAPVEDPTAWVPLLAQDPAQRVLGADAFAQGAVLTLRRDGVQMLRVLPRDGSPVDVVPADAGGLVRLSRNDDHDQPRLLVATESWVRPTVWEEIGWDGSRAEVHRLESLGTDLAQYVVERRMLPSHDGVLVPVDLARHVSTPLDGTAPCLLYGYGAYEAPCDPDWFETGFRALPSLLDRGVVLAVGHPRGGGEMGRRWWDDGHLATKQNTFADQAAVAERLLDGVVSRIVTRGLSAGGLLQGALYSQRPELFAGVVAEVPFVDVITTMLDASLPLTAQEWLEWGDPREEDQYAVMVAYSPIDNLPPLDHRPPLLVTGAVHDPRVLVREPARWVARLRASDPARGHGDDPSSPVSPRTVLFRCETGAGAHAGPSGRYAELEYEAEIYAWTLAALGS
ncbi:MAG: prolyl oligopeptidase family serine peptidase [Actinobacteria bacterium]|nr:prolyl oligopeptidase family serine peptidase [Actinomycetota bacterium]